MKRRRGGKSGYNKKFKKVDSYTAKDPPSAADGTKTEDNSSGDEGDDGKFDHGIETEPPSLELEKLNNKSSTNIDLPKDKSTGKLVYSRVKVKLKSSKALEPRPSNLDSQTPSDTDKSHRAASVEMLDTSTGKREDTANSDGHSSGMQKSGKSPLKPGTLKIKSSKAPGSSERGVSLSDNEKPVDSIPRNLQRETLSSYGDPRYSETELKAALDVIKKVMKMDAAAPFNAPVDPVALGIPDYFDVIDTPMDFGSIRQDLERGNKYMNSEDVYKDVQFIWYNCEKYNNKGDYILDLMKRVKKNFMKYWTAAGLFMDMPTSEGVHEDVVLSTKPKLHKKSKSKHKHRGVESHKSDCLCAVCVVRRRRKENGASAAIQAQIVTRDAQFYQETKPEYGSPLDNPGSEDGSSSLEQSGGNKDDDDAGDVLKLESPEKQDMSTLGKQEISNGTFVNPNPLENGTKYSGQQSEDDEMDMNLQADPDELNDGTIPLQEGSRDISIQTEVQEDPLEENHSVLQIFDVLFPVAPTSVWNGPHSLFHRQVPARDNPIHAALATFLNQ